MDQKMKCIRFSDLSNIPSDLLPMILSHLGLKANIQASAVCKTWFKAAVSVRKWQPRPWLFYRQKGSEEEIYILFDTLKCQTYKKCFPELKNSFLICYSRDGWLLVKTNKKPVSFLLNPFTSECINLPEGSGYCSAFSAAPTSSSCLVISIVGQLNSCLEIKTWRPMGEATVWTTHLFENQLPTRRWEKSVFSNGMFYCISACGYLGVFDPSNATWNILPAEPCPALSPFVTRLFLMTEHEGNIFAMYIRENSNNPSVFKLNHKEKVWEERRELGGLTVFASYSTSITRAGLSVEERDRIYPSHENEFDRDIMYYSIADEKNSHLPFPHSLHYDSAWVDPPHDNLFNL